MRKKNSKRIVIERQFKPRPCAFCKDNAVKIDYKDVPLLRRYLSDKGKIRSRRVTGNCVRHQRELARAVKNSREIALLPFISIK